jgi:hypothetical protein
LGQKQTLRRKGAMSALTSKADIARMEWQTSKYMKEPPIWQPLRVTALALGKMRGLKTVSRASSATYRIVDTFLGEAVFRCTS